MSEIKVGDRVRYVGPTWIGYGGSPSLGLYEEGAVSRVTPLGYSLVKFDTGDSYILSRSEIELVDQSHADGTDALDSMYGYYSTAQDQEYIPAPTTLYGKPIKSKPSNGGSTEYYKLPEYATELRHLISHKSMSKSRGDIFKACYRLGEKEGTDILYDLNKMKFFVEDLIEMYQRGEHV